MCDVFVCVCVCVCVCVVKLMLDEYVKKVITKACVIYTYQVGGARCTLIILVVVYVVNKEIHHKSVD